jgi:ADP-ribosylglycohydrolase
MRVPAVGYAFSSVEEVLAEAAQSAKVTHNHPEGIKGAQATAAAIFLARSRKSKESIKDSLQRQFGYNLSDRLDDLRPTYKFTRVMSGHGATGAQESNLTRRGRGHTGLHHGRNR